MQARSIEAVSCRNSGRPGRRAAAVGIGRTLVLSAAVALAIGACKPMVDYRGNKPDNDKVAAIKPGQSTKVQVTGLLGSPTTVSPLDERSWYYISSREETYAFLKPRVKSQEIVEINFDQAGVVTGVKRYSLKDAKKVRYVARTTPTRIDEPSLLRSLYDLIITGPVNRTGTGGTNRGFER